MAANCPFFLLLQKKIVEIPNIRGPFVVLLIMVRLSKKVFLPIDFRVP